MMMLSLMVAMTMNMAKTQDPVDEARKAFGNCLAVQHNDAVKSKMAVVEFNKLVDAACPDERKAYFDVVVKAQRGYGDNQADAEDYAGGEVQAVVDKITESFGGNVESGSTIVPEK